MPPSTLQAVLGLVSDGVPLVRSWNLPVIDGLEDPARSVWSQRFSQRGALGSSSPASPFLYLLRAGSVPELSAFLVETAGRGLLCNYPGASQRDWPQGVHPALPLWLQACEDALPFDPATAAETRAIARAALWHCYREGAPGFCYMALNDRPTVGTRAAAWLPGNTGAELSGEQAEAAFRGMYRWGGSDGLEGVGEPASPPQLHLCGAGRALRQVLEAGELLRRDWGVAAEVWSCPSYTRLAREGAGPGSHLRRCLGASRAPVVAVTGYMAHVAAQIGAHVSGRFAALGADTHRPLDVHWIALVALRMLAGEGAVAPAAVADAVRRYGLGEHLS